MKFYIRKPTIIEAGQFRIGVPLPKGVCLKSCLDGDWREPHVHTMHQNQAIILKDGDWVLPEPDGIHFYPCDNEVFEKTYDKYEQPMVE